jgi:parallel beta-helix repeat protein
MISTTRRAGAVAATAAAACRRVAMMARRIGTVLAAALLGVTGLTVAAAPAGADPGRVIVVHGSIQAAVDAARPGDTVLVPPGRYEGGVVVDTSDLTIRGSRAAVIDATGHPYGIQVGTGHIAPGPDGQPACPAATLHGIRVDGLTIQNAEDTGLFMIGVDGFRIRGGRYLDNEEYGPFPICSRHGVIELNDVSGTDDAGVYVGDDVDVTVRDNRVHGCAIGVEIENSVHSVVRHNVTTGNTVGVLVSLLPGLPMPVNDDTLIAGNLVGRNNLPNPVPVDSGDDVGLLPTGSGILNVGGDRVVIVGNAVVGNDSVGVGIVQSPFGPADPRLEVNPDGDQVRANTILHNGRHPDPERATTPGADIVYDGTGVGTCFAANRFGTDYPPGITALFACR